MLPAITPRPPSDRSPRQQGPAAARSPRRPPVEPSPPPAGPPAAGVRPEISAEGTAGGAIHEIILKAALKRRTNKRIVELEKERQDAALENRIDVSSAAAQPKLPQLGAADSSGSQSARADTRRVVDTPAPARLVAEKRFIADPLKFNRVPQDLKSLHVLCSVVLRKFALDCEEAGFPQKGCSADATVAAIAEAIRLYNKRSILKHPCDLESAR